MKQLTVEEDIACRDHLDAIMEITGNLKLSTMFDTIKSQMHLSKEDEAVVFGIIEKQINAMIFSAFAQTGEKLKELMNNPVLQAEMRANIDALKTPKGGSEVDIPEDN
jgi:hypothetical protein